jgi:hypothetical protein
LNDESRSDEQVKLRDDFYIPFSKGSSACIGIQYVLFYYFKFLNHSMSSNSEVLPSNGAEWLTGNYSFAYFELFLSLSKILQNFQITLPPTPAWPVIPREARLPERLEWVAAVPTVDLNVLIFPRGLKR